MLPQPAKHTLRLPRSPLWIILAATVCFFVANLTNDTILHALEAHHLLYGSIDRVLNQQRTTDYFLIPLKSFLFFILTAFLAAQLTAPVRRVSRLLNRAAVTQSLLAFLVALALMATVLPISFGRSYARISTNPFNQLPGPIYRRLLIPGLASLYHLNGVLYIVLCWAIVFAAILTAKAFLATRSHALSMLEETSLLTVGIFASSFQFPGYPESAVLFLALLALMDVERHRRFTPAALAALCLALLAHESAAFILFAPMILFLFGRRSWLPCALVGLLYGVAVLSNFSFNPTIPIHIQGTVSDIPAPVYFLRSPTIDLAAIFFSFKLLWLLVPIAILRQFRHNLPTAFFVLSGFTLAIASMYIAVDYTRMVGFAIIPLLVCLADAPLPPSIMRPLMILNLMIPTLYVSGNTGIAVARGLYALIAHLLIRVPIPTL